MAFEELGATFIKLAQILSTRPDLLPPEYQSEFAKLQDQAPRVPGAEVQQVVERELGKPLAELFRTFDIEPLAAASIGQVHSAELLDGTQVVVKVRRPGVENQIEEDLEIIQHLAHAASQRWEFAQQYDLVGLSREFAQTLRAELDYLREGRNAERIATNFPHSATLHVPKVFWQTTTTQVLTLERIEGIKINDLPGLEAAQIDRAKLAERATNIILKMIFEDGFYHADLHPGNFFIEPGGRIGLIDFGMVGIVDEPTRQLLVKLFRAITNKNTGQMVDAFLELGITRHKINREELRRDLEELISRYYSLPLGDIAVVRLLEDTLVIVRTHSLQLPSNLALLFKTTMMCEGLGTQLDPSFCLSQVIEPYARRLMLEEFSPARWAKKLGRSSLEGVELGAELPQQLRRLLGDLERGDLEIGMEPRNFEPVLNRLERLVNRIVLSILAAAFVIGFATLMAFYHPPGWEQWTGGLLAIGFVLASVLGIYLAWSILRSGRKG
jgi:ubiquinone biosynthesis protein